MPKMSFCWRNGGTLNRTEYSLCSACRSLISSWPGDRFRTLKTTSVGSALYGIIPFGIGSASAIMMIGGQLTLYSLSRNVVFHLAFITAKHFTRIETRPQEKNSLFGQIGEPKRPAEPKTAPFHGRSRYIGRKRNQCRHGLTSAFLHAMDD